MRTAGPLAAIFGLLLAGCAAPDRATVARDGPRDSPSVVVFFTDDQGYGDLGCFGHPTIATPNIDHLAAGGARLTQFYVPSPVCSPSRAALLTGCYPRRVDMHRHVVFPEDDFGLHPDEVTLAEMLRDAGYATGVFGKWHLGHRRGLLPTDQGFDVFFGIPYSNDMSQFHRPAGASYRLHLPLMRGDRVIEWEPDQTTLTRDCTDEALAFLEDVKDRPFLLYMPFAMPHIPLFASEAHRGTSARGLYGDVIEEIDANVGRVLDALERHGIADDTLVIFTSDNGPWLTYREDGGSAGPLRGGKGSNWEGGQRVPAVVRWPGGIPGGTVRREVMTTMDIVPTIVGLAGIELPADRPVDGRDVSSVLSGNAAAAADLVERPFLYYSMRGELAAVRRGPWKLVLHEAFASLDADQLFHVEIDVGEQWDRAGREPSLAAELRAIAIALDAEIAENARPRGSGGEVVFDPRHPVDPDGMPFELPAERRRPR